MTYREKKDKKRRSFLDPIYEPTKTLGKTPHEELKDCRDQQHITVLESTAHPEQCPSGLKDTYFNCR